MVADRKPGMHLVEWGSMSLFREIRVAVLGVIRVL